MVRRVRNDFEVRFDWAETQLKQIKDHARIWADREANGVTHKLNRNPLEYVVSVNPTQAPRELALLIGDCLHSFRVSLDHLAYQMAVRIQDPPKPEVAEASGFPIIGHRPISAKRKGRGKGDDDRFADSAAHKLQSLPRAIISEIRKVQPYQTGPGWDKHALWVLSELERVSKHRELPVALLSITSHAFTPPGLAETGRGVLSGDLLAYIESLRLDGPIEGRTDLMRYLYWTDTTPARKPMKLDIRPVFEVAFAKESPAANGVAVGKTLTIIRDYIAKEVIPPLMTFV